MSGWTLKQPFDAVMSALTGAAVAPPTLLPPVAPPEEAAADAVT